MIESVTLHTADGVALDGDQHLVPGAHLAAVLCHPHPLYGGDRRSNVVEALFTALPAAGISVVRFDFRGAGRSEGTHDGKGLERLDVIAALDHLADCAPGAALVLCGYSFGAMVCSTVDDPRPAASVLIACPALPQATCGHDARPKLVLVPQHDQFCTPDQARPQVAGWLSTTVVEIPSADHFLGGRTGKVALEVEAWLADLSHG